MAGKGRGEKREHIRPKQPAAIELLRNATVVLYVPAYWTMSSRSKGMVAGAAAARVLFTAAHIVQKA